MGFPRDAGMAESFFIGKKGTDPVDHGGYGSAGDWLMNSKMNSSIGTDELLQIWGEAHPLKG